MIKEFLVESFENLSTIGEEITKFEKNTGDKELLNDICRKVHTVKGAANFLKFTRLQEITHSAERSLYLLRDGLYKNKLQAEGGEIMKITERQIHLVQSTWAKIKPAAAGAANIFYSHLFRLNPDLRPLFKEDRSKQEELLISMITMAVNSLYQPDDLEPTFEALGRRHLSYGVRKGDYQVFWAALLPVLKTGIREDFTPEVEEAWKVVYDLLTCHMVEAR